METRSGFRGVYPMVYALFGADGMLSRTAMRRQVEAMLAHGVHGVAVLGMASEVNKLSTTERHMLMEWVAEDIGGRVPLAVTVAEPSIAGQVAFVEAARGLGAQWVILQPPPVKGVPERELIRFFGTVCDKFDIPVGIQNAPEYLGIGLSADGVRTLNRNHPNMSIVKLEATAVAIRRLLDTTQGAVDVFNGRGGIEITDSIRAGSVGIIPGGETFDILVRIFERMAEGGAAAEGKADQLYAKLLPALVFLMESMDNFLVYGKAILGRRLELQETEVRPPFTPPTEFGLDTALRYADALGKL